MKHSIRFTFVSLAACTLAPSLLAAALTGVVTDRTTGKPAAGDTVSLLSTHQGLQELARTTSGPDGRFSIQASGNGMHLLRVEHAKVGYYTVVKAGSTTANLDVYDVTPSRAALKIVADVIHIEANNQTATIVETLLVQNASQPARTQFTPAGIGLSLPHNAQPTAAYATDSSNVTEPLTPMRAGKNGLWSLIYPLRPGQTQLEIDYSLPWSASGGFTFHPTPSLPATDFAIMLPNSMQFTGSGFRAINQDPSYQTFLLAKPAPGKPIDFTVSGTGTIPTPGQNGQGQGQGQNQDQSAQGAPGGGLGAPIDTPGPLYHNKWMILSGLCLLFVIAAAFTVRRSRPGRVPAALTPTQPRPASPRSASSPASKATQPAPRSLPPSPTQGSGDPFLLALREELFHLESDRAQGSITEAQYTEAKAALDLLLTRALHRTREQELVHS